MISAETGIQDDRKCSHAAEVINDLIRNECQGFILPPSEVRRLLGIPGHCRTWYLHKSIAVLRKKLAGTFVSMAVSPDLGISFTLYEIPRQSMVRVSPIN
jgi:hypothetical protein